MNNINNEYTLEEKKIMEEKIFQQIDWEHQHHLDEFKLFTIVWDDEEIEDPEPAEHPQKFYDSKENALRALKKDTQVTFEIIGISPKVIDLLKEGKKIIKVWTIWFQSLIIDEEEFMETSRYNFFFTSEEEAKEYHKTHPCTFGWNLLEDEFEEKREEGYDSFCYIMEESIAFDLEKDITLSQWNKKEFLK